MSNRNNSNNDNDFHAPIDGTLDLHQFLPQDTKAVVEEFIYACLEKKIYTLRIVHGKGIGVKREIVQAVLTHSPSVKSFRHEESGGGWGATVVDLFPTE